MFGVDTEGNLVGNSNCYKDDDAEYLRPGSDYVSGNFNQMLIVNSIAMESFCFERHRCFRSGKFFFNLFEVKSGIIDSYCWG